MKRSTFEYSSSTARRKHSKVSLFLLLFGVVVVAVAIAFASTWVINFFRERNNRSTQHLYDLWQEGDYAQTYSLSKQINDENSFDTIAITLHGYSAYYLALAQTDSSLAQMYLDDAIVSLRVAKIFAKEKVIGQIYYMLGKAYFLKNNLNSYSFFSDLVIKYLSMAKEKNYSPSDISEYMGLAYAALDMRDESIAAFTNALMIRESDVLLFSIGEQYFKNENYAVAKPYFFRIVTKSPDDSLVLKSKNLLGLTYIEEKNYTDAENEFRSILEKDVNYADAYYGLGIVYEKQGDLVKARSYWRSALKAQAGHSGATEKLSA